MKALNNTLLISEATGTDPTLDLWVEHSADGVNWRNLYDDFKQGTFPEVFFTFNLDEFAGTNPTFDMEIEHSTDGKNWNSLFEDFLEGIYSRKEAADSETIHITRFSRFLRGKWTMGGTDPVATFELIATAHG